MTDTDLSAELKAVGDALASLARKAQAAYGDEIKSLLEAVKIKLNDLEKHLDDQTARRESE
jgi:hypothetical protein